MVTAQVTVTGWPDIGLAEALTEAEKPFEAARAWERVAGLQAQAAADKELYAIDQKGPCAWVLGAEGEGMRRLTRERCDRLVRIPMHGQVESLNVSVAAGICLYEALRQREQGLALTIRAIRRFTVIATGPGTLTYQWFCGSTPIDGATGSSLPLYGLQATDQVVIAVITMELIVAGFAVEQVVALAPEQLDDFGLLVGPDAASGVEIDAAIRADGQNIGFAVPVDTVNRIVPELIKHGKLIRPGLGVSLVPDSIVKRWGIKGLVIGKVSRGGSADRAGLAREYAALLANAPLDHTLPALIDEMKARAPDEQTRRQLDQAMAQMEQQLAAAQKQAAASARQARRREFFIFRGRRLCACALRRGSPAAPLW